MTILVVAFLKSQGQDDSFLNTNQYLIYTNPSFARTNGFIRNQTIYKNLYPNIPDRVVSFGNSYDAYIEKLNGAIAVSYFTNDVARGLIKSNWFNLSYAPHFILKQSGAKIIPSLQLSYFNKILDRSLITYGGPFSSSPWHNPNLIHPRKSNLDFSSSILFVYKSFYFGATVFHITQPDEGIFVVSRLPARLCINASYNKHVSENVLLNFSTVFNSQGNYQNIQLTVNSILYKHLALGLGIHSSRPTLFGSIGYRNDILFISLLYSEAIVPILASAGNSFELTLSLNLRNKEKRNRVVNFEE